MNLDDMLREPSVIDHSWWTSEGGLGRQGKPSVDEIVQNSKKQHNIAPALEIEWGGGGPTVDINEPAGVVKRQIPDEFLGDAGDVIVFARDQMNRGRMGRGLRAVLRAKFDEKTLKVAEKQLKKLFAIEGVAGCFAVDVTGYQSCSQAMEAASKSPYKRFIGRVIGCSCGSPHMLPDGREMKAAMPESTGNPMDDFLASEKPHKPTLVAHCPSTMLPIFAEDLDPSEMDQSMIDLMSLTGLPTATAKELRAGRKAGKYKTNAEMLRAAFLSIENIDVVPDMEPVIAPVEDNLGIGLGENALDVDEAAAAALDVEIGPLPENRFETPSSMSLDVDMGPLLENEFEGADIVELDEAAAAAPGELPVERGGDLTV